MKEKYLVINGGSSSLKFSLYEVENGQETEIVKGLIERIGIKGSCWTLKCNGKSVSEEEEMPNHKIALEVMLDKLKKYNFIQDKKEIKGVGHRVLHGGEIYSDSVIIDETVLSNIKSLEPLGPNHIPGQLDIINGMLAVLPDATQVSVFDTAFHQTMPEVNSMYPIDYEYYEKYGVRKYGFHGTSHKYITEQMKEKLNKEDVNLITCHIGNGVSVSAIKNSKSIYNSMGFTPLEGLMMGTRSGSGLDPAIIEFLCNNENMTVTECTSILNKRSGLLGISGVSSDIRDLLEAERQEVKRASLALRMFEESICKAISKVIYMLDGEIDGIVFTAGIGENVNSIRENVVNKLSKTYGISLDKEKNENITKIKEGVITTEDSKFPVYVIPTNEELMILRDTVKLSKEIKKSNVTVNLSKENIKTKILKYVK